MDAVAAASMAQRCGCPPGASSICGPALRFTTVVGGSFRAHGRLPRGGPVAEGQVRSDATALLDWRRQVAALYARVRAADDPRVGHEIWQAARNELLGSHQESPIPASLRAGFSSVPVASYDPAPRPQAHQCPGAGARTPSPEQRWASPPASPPRPGRPGRSKWTSPSPSRGRSGPRGRRRRAGGRSG